ncbi:ComEA family DNA-binding protein [Bacterioplanoides sp.]|uniref:ComEA family DNA-binding protein n=1 Tax=Bacterioplanoides sp. TaxID=2066072 RepID=UPI003B5CBAA7
MMKWIQKALFTLCLSGAAFLAMANELATPVNINTATAEQLTELKGIGPNKAKAIVQYRQEKGPFSSIEELVLVKGIGQSTLKKNDGMLITTTE